MTRQDDRILQRLMKAEKAVVRSARNLTTRSNDVPKSNVVLIHGSRMILIHACRTLCGNLAFGSERAVDKGTLP